MRNERVLAVSCNGWAKQGLCEMIVNQGKEGGHELAGVVMQPRHIAELPDNASPTIALMSPNLYTPKQITEITANLRTSCEGIVIIAVTDERQKPEWADHHISYSASQKGKNVMDFVTNLEH